MRAAGYVRVSSEDQRLHGWNLAADRERIERTIVERGWELHAIYDDGGRQGDDPERPGFLRMLAEVDRFDVLIVRDLDRFSRRLAIYASAADALVQAGVALYEFEGEGTGIRLLDLSDEDDRALADVKAVFAQMEKAKIKRRVRQAKAARAAAGGHPGGRRPYGYDLVDTGRTGQHDKPIRELRPHPVERAVVVRIFEMAEATSQRQIARILNEEGVASSTGGRWTQSVVARLLGNPLYLGQIRRRVGGEWVLYEGQHEAIVSEALWRRVNASRATPERRAGGRPLLSGHLLTRGLLRCGCCGSAMIPIAAQRGRAEAYTCIGRRDHGPGFCRQPQVQRTLIDGALLAQLTSRYFDLDGTRDRLRERQATELPLAQAAVAEAERELALTEARIARVDRGWQDGVISDAAYRRQSAGLEEALAGAQHAVVQATRRVEQIEAAGASTDVEEALLGQLADLRQLVSGTVDQARDVEALRTVIRQLFASVELITPTPDEVEAAAELAPILSDPPVAAGCYWLELRVRLELLDAVDLEPVKVPLPDVTPSTCRRS